MSTMARRETDKERARRLSKTLKINITIVECVEILKNRTTIKDFCELKGVNVQFSPCIPFGENKFKMGHTSKMVRFDSVPPFIRQKFIENNPTTVGNEEMTVFVDRILVTGKSTINTPYGQVVLTYTLSFSSQKNGESKEICTLEYEVNSEKVDGVIIKLIRKESIAKFIENTKFFFKDKIIS